MAKKSTAVRRAANLKARFERIKLAVQAVDELTVAYLDGRADELEDFAREFQLLTTEQTEEQSVN